MAESSRTPLERFNTIVFAVLLGALALSFAERTPFVIGLEVACRVAVVALVVGGLVRFRRDYFTHWTSTLAAAVALLSLFRLVQLSLG